LYRVEQLYIIHSILNGLKYTRSSGFSSCLFFRIVVFFCFYCFSVFVAFCQTVVFVFSGSAVAYFLIEKLFSSFYTVLLLNKVLSAPGTLLLLVLLLPSLSFFFRICELGMCTRKSLFRDSLSLSPPPIQLHAVQYLKVYACKNSAELVKLELA